ncbi:hypothetical protein ABVK25_003398 [Lepraria finkii]|uniref:C2H2-type domain-containing protein n=1 Tax=Lepraria finkii TaxID=1340010 RepID=A0ABR4BEU3_9LECA
MPFAHPSVRRQDLSPSESPSPSTSPYLSTTYFNPHFDKTAYSTPNLSEQLELNYYTAPVTTDLYCIDSRESTPSDRFSWGLSDSQFMQNNPPQYPQVNIQHSTPNNGLPSANSPPPMVDGHDFAQPSWNSFPPDTSYLAPNVQQQYNDQTSYYSHKRLSSSSSIGSAGPDSPFTQSSTYPHIVDPDSQSVHSAHLDSFDGSYSNAGQYSKPTFPSPLSQTSDHSFYPTFQNTNLQGNDAVSMTGAQTAMGNQQRAPTRNRRQSSSRGPYGGEAVASSEMRSNIPQFERTESDIYQDELYNPATQAPVPSAHARPSVPTSGNLLSPHRSTFSSLLQQANSRHMSARSASPVTQNVPRQFSQYNTAGPGFSHSNPSSPATRLNSAAQIREHQKMDEAQAYAQQHQQSRHDLLNTPKTISPKEALLDYNESDEASKVTLFPSPKRESQASATSYGRRRIGRAENSNEQSFTSMATRRRESSSTYSTSSSAPQHSTPNIQFMPPSVPGMPQQYPFISQSCRQSSSVRSGGSDQVLEFPASLNSMESTRSESAQGENVRLIPEASQRSATSSQEGPTQRPLDTSAGHGTYTCTTPDCHSRFDTSSKLQKHRKEAHRQQSPFAASTPKTPSSASAPHNPQAAQNNVSRNNAPGPHKCEKTNPSTGKSCNTVFSRSYDLTRHEDTIHNNRKQKVRCHHCTEEKTFSRNDALTRHMRVVHPDVDFPGKTRRGRNSEGADVVRQRIESGRGGR